MSEPFVYDPRCILCKDPFGAVVCGKEVSFHCRPLTEEGFTHAMLVLRYEFAQKKEIHEMTLVGPDAERTHFSLTLQTPKEPDLLWYHFYFWRDDKSGCDLDKSGYRSDGQIEPWQLTVYEESVTPEWFGKGVTYQIFPDRFCRLPSDKADVHGLVGDRVIHENWSDLPEWRPDLKGEVRNRDFFGGSLQGITSKLPWLEDLGVTTLYLCPIFESASNHRYNTADYKKIDPLLGTEEDFRTLCAEAKKRGIHVILDGVFNHTGSQSLYFNADGFYPTLGAAQSKKSPYYKWFSFHPWPRSYDAWWGIYTLPAVREDCPSYVDFIIENEDSVMRHWLKAGASGWRLDVADELPDWFIEKARTALDETAQDGLLIGEVWEDASNKTSYSQRRRYLLGKEVHSVMNYPFRTALLDYLGGVSGADDFRDAMETIRENYPPAAFYSAMNFLGTHDTARILTVLGAEYTPQDKDERAYYRLSPAELEKGIARVKLAALVMFTFPGSPTVFYGDELGMEGFEDPFNRGTYPWDGGKTELLPHFTLLGRLRRKTPALQTGAIEYLCSAGPVLAYARSLDDQRVVTVVNAGDAAETLELPWKGATAMELLSNRTLSAKNGVLTLELPPRSGLLLV